MAIFSGSSTSSESGGLRTIPFALNVAPRDYKDYLETERFDVMRSNCKAEAVCNARHGSIATKPLLREYAVGLTGADATRSYVGVTLHMLTFHSYITKKNMDVRSCLILLLVIATHFWAKISQALDCIISVGFSLMLRCCSLIIWDTGTRK